MGREEWLLAENIEQELKQAEMALLEVGHLQEIGAADSEDPDDDRYERAEDALAFHVERSFRSIGALADRMGVSSISTETAVARLDRAALSATCRPFDGEIHCAALSRVYACFAPLRAMTTAKSVTVHDVLRTILRSTGKIIEAKGHVPTNEAQVRNPVLDICQFAFNDAIRETPIPKRVTCYKADISIRSLRTLVEFKFIDSRDQMKSALDGVYADMKAYRDPEWETYYSVFYMTGPYFTQEEVDEEFLYVGADKSWQPLVVQGSGRRQKKSGRTEATDKHEGS